MFNAFNLFNFFQQPNTGRIPDKEEFNRNYITNFEAISGRVADFNWFFPYLGRTIPSVIFDVGGNYPINLFPDANDADVFGIRTPILSNNLSGSLYKDINNSFFNLDINGKIFPHNKDLSNSKIELSGFLKESPRVINSIQNSISGSINDFNFNYNNISNKISGYLEDSKTNFNFLKNQISGFISGDHLDKNKIYLKSSGLFFPISKDSLNIKYYLSGYYSEAISKYEIKTGDSINLKYYINEYRYGLN